MHTAYTVLSASITGITINRHNTATAIFELVFTTNTMLIAFFTCRTFGFIFTKALAVDIAIRVVTIAIITIIKRVAKTFITTCTVLRAFITFIADVEVYRTIIYDTANTRIFITVFAAFTVFFT